MCPCKKIDAERHGPHACAEYRRDQRPANRCRAFIIGETKFIYVFME
ncbi:hypothetical protein PSFL111601_23855 [Pseudomonas floridensis]